MQRQPTPHPDPIRSRHFLPQSEALAEASTNKNALTNLSYLPSSVGDAKKADTKKSSDRDKEMTKAADLKSWNAKSA